MKKVFIALCLISVLLAACGGAQGTETVQPEFNIPKDLGNGWERTKADETDIYVYGGTTGVHNESTGWTSFDFGDHQVFVALTSFPNPTDEGAAYGRTFDVQWVEGDEVKKHATCWDVNEYNRQVQYGNKAERDYEIDLPSNIGLADDSRWASADQSLDYVYGCRFGNDEADTVYLVHHHLVNSAAIQALTQFAPTGTATVTPAPTLTPGPGTPTAIVPTATLTNLGTDIPFGCGSFARLTGTVNWNAVASLSIDCVKSIYTFVFKGDDVSQLPVDFWWDQATNQFLARTKIPDCQVNGAQVVCQRFFFNVSVEKPAAEIGSAQVFMPSGCGNVAIDGVVDWSKIASVSVNCNNSRFQISFRGQNMDRVWFYIEAEQNPAYVQGYTNLIGCVVNKQKVTESRSGWADTTKKATMVCEVQGINLTATPR